MQTTTTTQKDITIALLMEDAAAAKEISQALRPMGIFAHYYRDLDEFWVAATLQTPHLTVVDVAKMSMGDTQFRHHPKVQSGQLAYAFYSKEETKFLLNSTFGLSPVGFVHADLALAQQVQALVEQRRKMMSMEEQVKRSGERVERLQGRSARLIAEKNQTEAFRSHFDFVFHFAKDLETAIPSGDFVQAFFQRMSDWEAVKNMSFYALNASGNKLMAPAIRRKRYLELPTLWLGKDCKDGIENFAAEMAWQVASDLFEDTPVELRIQGGALHPELIIYMEVDREMAGEFPWQLFEMFLSGVYRRFRLGNRQIVSSEQVKTVWEALDLMDTLHFQSTEGDEKVVLLSLVPLMNLIRRKADNKFHFSAFCNDFFLQLTQKISPSTKFSFLGPWHVIMFTQQGVLEREFNTVKEWSRQFAYWKYFEDDSRVIGENAQPNVRLLAPSSVNYLRFLEREFDEVGMQEAQTRWLGEGKSKSIASTISPQ